MSGRSEQTPWSRRESESSADRARSHFCALVVARRFGLAVFEGKLFAVGGWGSSYQPLSSVETLSSPSGAWAIAANGLNVARVGCRVRFLSISQC